MGSKKIAHKVRKTIARVKDMVSAADYTRVIQLPSDEHCTSSCLHLLAGANTPAPNTYNSNLHPSRISHTLSYRPFPVSGNCACSVHTAKHIIIHGITTYIRGAAARGSGVPRDRLRPAKQS